MKIFVFVLMLISSWAFSQVSNVIRHPDSYKDFAFEGVRIVQVEEVASPGNEENVIIFSKIEKGAQPDKMFIQRFTKQGGTWNVVSKKTINHAGVISSWGSRKAFGDYDKDKSADAILVYSLSDYDFNQQSVHVILSKGKEIYEIASDAASDYSKPVFSDNFNSLPTELKKRVMDFWTKLDKK